MQYTHSLWSLFSEVQEHFPVWGCTNWTIFRLRKQKLAQNNQDNQIQNTTLCNTYFSKKRYTQRTMGSGSKPPEAGEFWRIFVLKVTLQKVTSNWKLRIEKNWGSRIYYFLPNNFAAGIPGDVLLSIVFLKPTVSIRPSVPPSGSHKCLRFGFWSTLHYKAFYLLTYLLLNNCVEGAAPPPPVAAAMVTHCLWSLPIISIWYAFNAQLTPPNNY